MRRHMVVGPSSCSRRASHAVQDGLHRLGVERATSVSSMRRMTAAVAARIGPGEQGGAGAALADSRWGLGAKRVRTEADMMRRTMRKGRIVPEAERRLTDAQCAATIRALSQDGQLAQR